MNKPHSMKDDLKSIRAQVPHDPNYKPNSDKRQNFKGNKRAGDRVVSLKLIITPDSNEITVEAVGRVRDRFKSVNSMFMELRRLVREATECPDWEVRYASQVTNPLVPLLVSTSQMKVIMDPMAPYRDPLTAMSMRHSINLYVLPGRAFYYHNREALEAILGHDLKVKARHVNSQNTTRPDSTRVLGDETEHGAGIGPDLSNARASEGDTEAPAS